MRNDYSWRDGWALTYPHSLPITEKKQDKVVEKIYRCSCVGVLVYHGNACPICNRRAGHDNA